MKMLLAALAAFAALAFAGSALGETFITDTLAPGGKAPARQGYRFITDTLAPGGKAPARQGYRFITDTLAPGGGSHAVVVQGSSNFNWSDAGVGAGVAAGAMLALIGSTLILIRRQGRLVV
jgi:hypothetical protein